MKQWILLFVLLATAGPTSAHPGAKDSYGCHNSRKDYHCHSGIHKGKKFATEAEALKVFKSPVIESEPDIVLKKNTKRKPTQTDDPKILKVISWNVKHLGRKKFNAVAASSVLQGADILTFQEVNKSNSGHWTIIDLRDKMQEATQEKYCVALSEIPTHSKERYGYLWRNGRVAYVKINGEVMEDCPTTAITIRLGVKHAAKIVREPAFGTFQFKPQKKNFVLASIHLVPTKKSPEKEVQPLFDTFKEVSDPTIIAGDYNLDSSHGSFEAARALSFLPAMVGIATSLKQSKRELHQPYDNFWIRRIRMTSYDVRNLYEYFPDMDKREIYKNLSDHSPIYGEFQFEE